MLLPPVIGMDPRARLRCTDVARYSGPTRPTGMSGRSVVRAAIWRFASACSCRRFDPTEVRPKNAKATSPIQGDSMTSISQASPVDGLRFRGTSPSASTLIKMPTIDKTSRISAVHEPWFTARTHGLRTENGADMGTA